MRDIVQLYQKVDNELGEDLRVKIDLLNFFNSKNHDKDEIIKKIDWKTFDSFYVWAPLVVNFPNLDNIIEEITSVLANSWK